jgi:hypothetical protein
MDEQGNWVPTEESEPHSFTTSQYSPVGLLAELVNFNFLDPKGRYELRDYRHHAIVVDSKTNEPILQIEEA